MVACVEFYMEPIFGAAEPGSQHPVQLICKYTMFIAKKIMIVCMQDGSVVFAQCYKNESKKQK